MRLLRERERESGRQRAVSCLLHRREILQDEEERLQGGPGDLQEVPDQGDKDRRVHEAG